MDESQVLTNRGRYDADTLRAAYTRLYRPWFWLMLALGLLFLGAAIYFLVRRYDVVRASPLLMAEVGLILLCSLLYFRRAFTTVPRSVRRAIRRLEESRRVTGYDTVFRFLDAEIRMEASISAEAMHLSYDAVRRLIPCAHLILIRTRSKQIVMLDPDRFENGTEEDFWALMVEKCPKAVPKALYYR